MELYFKHGICVVRMSVFAYLKVWYGNSILDYFNER